MRTTIKRALVSVYDKTYLPEFAAGLHDLGVELVSSASTAAAIEAAGLPVTRVEDVTGMPEMLDERVKTLHPKIHGGLLADRAKDSHLADLERHEIAPFDLVVSNLYPFLERPGIDTIDIGGPAMVRAAAKNHAWVTVVTSPAQYGALLDELRTHHGNVSEQTRRAFALEAFAHTAAYDAAIVQWLQESESLPKHLVIALERTDEDASLRREPASTRGALPPARDHELVGHPHAARRSRAVVPQPLRHRRGVEARSRPRRRSCVRDHQAREPVRSRGREHAA